MKADLPNRERIDDLRERIEKRRFKDIHQEDVRKLHAEVNQYINHRFLVIVTGMTAFRNIFQLDSWL